MRFLALPHYHCGPKPVNPDAAKPVKHPGFARKRFEATFAEMPHSN